jgi:ribosomal protein S18 acetylase RimI-like enzyme
MTAFPRLRMRLPLVEREATGPWRPRPIDVSDVPALGALMLAAYRGTVDDEGETEADAVDEVERTFDGAYGALLAEASFAVEDGERPIGASMTTIWERRPMLAYLLVHPEAKRRGIGTFLIAHTVNALLSAGYTELGLFVTEANAPAVSLYRKLGFEVVDRIAASDT